MVALVVLCRHRTSVAADFVYRGKCRAVGKHGDGDTSGFDRAIKRELEAGLVVVVYVSENGSLRRANLEVRYAARHQALGVAHEDGLHRMVEVGVESYLDSADFLGLRPREHQYRSGLAAIGQPRVCGHPGARVSVGNIRGLKAGERRGDGHCKIASGGAAVWEPKGERVNTRSFGWRLYRAFRHCTVHALG